MIQKNGAQSAAAPPEMRQAPAKRSGWSRSALIGIGLVVITVATYGRVVECNFVNFDDIDYVISNFGLLAHFDSASWNYFWTHLVSNNWHPLTMFSLSVDAHLWGLNPAGYHATNVLLHALNALLLFLILQKLTGARLRSAAVAALFALHPLHVESVAWISERKDVLCAMFLLLTVAAYIRYAAKPSLSRYGFVLVLMMLGLLSKPMLVTLPILLLLLDAWPLNRIERISLTGEPDRFPKRTWQQLALEKIPLLALSLIDGMITIYAQKSARNVLPNLGIGIRLANTFDACFWYLQKTLLPVNLTILYPHPENNISRVNVAFGFIVFVAITFIAVRFAKTKPHLFVGWGWFVIALLPVIGLIQVGGQAYADRYVYIPHMGLFVAIVWEVGGWISGNQTARKLCAVAFALIIGTCGVLSHVQVGHWKNSGTLWAHALDVIPENGQAHISLGDYLLVTGEFEKAREHIERGLQLTDQYSTTAYCDWGMALIRLNRPAEAEQKLRACLKLDPNHAPALGELIKLLVKQHRVEEAAEFSARYDKLVTRQGPGPDQDYKREVDLGLRRIREGKLAEARLHFERATQMAPYSAAAFNNLANAQMELQELPAAKQNFLKALELNPELSVAHFNLAVILEHDRDREGARQHYAEAYRINPQDLEAKQHAERLSKPPSNGN